MPEKNIKCRLCAGEAEYRFSKTILNDIQIKYFECSNCKSLLTEEPHWLDKAYSCEHSGLDTGNAQRNFIMSICTDAILSHADIEQQEVCLDYGGSNGLFTRTMRDKGYNFYRYEPYIENFYAPFHDAEENSIKSAKIITCFEVFEHFDKPLTAFSNILAYSPEIIIFSTELYSGQDENWRYLIADSGQHVFFYSKEALQILAEQNNMLFLSNGAIHIMIYKDASLLSQQQLNSIVALLTDSNLLFEKAFELLQSRTKDPFKYIWKDYEAILKRI